jgi:hypothetical protein
MREKIAVTPSARSVQTEKAPLDLAIPAPAVCTTGMDDPRSDPRRMMTYPDRRSASTSVPYSQTTRMSTENKNPVWAIPPWWKLDPSRSKLTDQMKVEGITQYDFDFGCGSAETIAADRTDQPGNFGTTLSVAVEGPDSWKVVRKKDGRILLTATWKLSKDGNTLTDDFTAIGPNGSTSNVNYAYKRTTGGPGFAGT